MQWDFNIVLVIKYLAQRQTLRHKKQQTHRLKCHFFFHISDIGNEFGEAEVKMLTAFVPT